MSVKVASTSSSIVRRKTASSACAGERADVLDRLGQLAPALASGMPASANGFQTSSMNSLMNSRETAREWRSTLSIMSSACDEARRRA